MKLNKKRKGVWRTRDVAVVFHKPMVKFVMCSDVHYAHRQNNHTSRMTTAFIPIDVSLKIPQTWDDKQPSTMLNLPGDKVKENADKRKEIMDVSDALKESLDILATNLGMGQNYVHIYPNHRKMLIECLTLHNPDFDPKKIDEMIDVMNAEVTKRINEKLAEEAEASRHTVGIVGAPMGSGKSLLAKYLKTWEEGQIK